MQQNQSDDNYIIYEANDEISKSTEEASEQIMDLSYEIMPDQGTKKSSFRGFALGFRKKTKDKVTAVLKDQEPYLKAVEMYGFMKMPQCRGTLAAKTSVRNLMEKLKHESPFGYGSNAVITCENEIARYLDEIEENVQGLFDEEISKEASEVIVINCKTIQAKLKIRTELKRK